MIAEKILHAILEIDAMAHEFTKEQWRKIKLIKEELKDAHITACELEKRMPIDKTLSPTNFRLREMIDG